MTRRHCLLSAVAAVAVLIYPTTAPAQDDPGKTKIGNVAVSVYYATNGDPEIAGAKTATIDKDTEKRLRGEEKLRFKHYRLLGRDVQPLLRSYENWAQPLQALG